MDGLGPSARVLSRARCPRAGRLHPSHRGPNRGLSPLPAHLRAELPDLCPPHLQTERPDPPPNPLQMGRPEPLPGTPEDGEPDPAPPPTVQAGPPSTAGRTR